ncbi:ATP-binding cassette domain-containing protein [Serratia marcescens]|uniref:ATP-binding cassette domain-containing protein n=1 Tax=Serratia marcescens TaxID=615 RepID=A0A939SV74_SERMA|nr:ATP-binding cassette domain-containing protein [Serratia marcescens]
MSFTIPAGHTVVVEPPARGKSTLSRLLFRFYDAERRITLDGRDIRQLTAGLRQAIGIVPQDTVFQRYAALQHRLRQTGSSDEEIERAVRLAHIHDFIVGLPDGYDTGWASAG